MKRCLADVNVLLALLVRQHQHHHLALTWFERLGAADAGICRLVQLALVRLLSNPSVLGSDVLSTTSSWNLVAELLQDERLEFLSEPPGLDVLIPSFLTHPAPSGKRVTDAYLAAFSIASSRPLVTLGRAFRHFPNLALDLLEP